MRKQIYEHVYIYIYVYRVMYAYTPKILTCGVDSMCNARFVLLKILSPPCEVQKRALVSLRLTLSPTVPLSPCLKCGVCFMGAVLHLKLKLHHHTAGATGGNLPEGALSTCKYMCICIGVYKYIYVYKYVLCIMYLCCMYIISKMCICTCLYDMCIYIYTHAYLHIYINLCVYTHLYIYIYIHMYIHIVRTDIQEQVASSRSTLGLLGKSTYFWA